MDLLKKYKKTFLFFEIVFCIIFAVAFISWIVNRQFFSMRITDFLVYIILFAIIATVFSVPVFIFEFIFNKLQSYKQK